MNLKISTQENIKSQTIRLDDNSLIHSNMHFRKKQMHGEF